MLLCVSTLNNGSYCQCPECKKQTYAQRKKFGSGGSKVILDKTGGKCWYCGVILIDNSRINDPQLSPKKKRNMFTIDHIIPMARKGSRTKVSNLVPCCNYCNNIKAHGDNDYLRAQLLFLENKWPKFSIHFYEFLVNHGIKLDSLGEYIFFFEQNNLLVLEDKNGDRQSGL